MLKLQIEHIFYLTVYFSYAYILFLSIKKSGQIYILTKTYSTYLTIQQTFNLIIHLTDWQQLWKLAIYMSWIFTDFCWKSISIFWLNVVIKNQAESVSFSGFWTLYHHWHEGPQKMGKYCCLYKHRTSHNLFYVIQKTAVSEKFYEKVSVECRL